MPEIKKIKKIEIKKPHKTIIKFQEEEVPQEQEEREDLQGDGIARAYQNPHGISAEWKPSPFGAGGDDSITTPDGVHFGSEKEYQDHLRKIHKKK